MRGEIGCGGGQRHRDSGSKQRKVSYDGAESASPNGQRQEQREQDEGCFQQGCAAHEDSGYDQPAAASGIGGPKKYPDIGGDEGCAEALRLGAVLEFEGREVDQGEENGGQGGERRAKGSAREEIDE